MADPLLAYCVKCKAKREMRDPQPVFLGGARPATQGTCSVCGTRLTRLGRTPAHENIPKPETPSHPAQTLTPGASHFAQGEGKKLVIVGRKLSEK